MAVNRKNFINKVDTGLKADKDYKRFYMSFKHDGKIKQKVIDYSNKDWDKRTRISKAKSDLLREKNKEIGASVNFTENSTLNQIKEIYFKNVRQNTDWTNELKNMYKLYIENSLGKKKIKSIRKVDIDALRASMEKQGHSVQTENGCSHRTIKKVLVQTLKPILQYTVDNKVMDSIPPISLPKQKTKHKKIVKDASVKLATLYKTINDLYSNNGFYRALFLFALYGRRWNEIRTLQWSDIDFLYNTYTIRAENNKINEDQTYQLPLQISDALNNIKDNKVGLVFKSPATGKELYSPKKQLAKIKEKANIPELTMHYFRHILVSAMGEMGVAGTILSASLGHTNLATVNDFYLSANHKKSSEKANIAIDNIISEQE